MGKGDKKGFIVYLDWEKQLSLLSDEERGKLFTALFNYEKTGETPDNLSDVASMAFSFIQTTLDRNREKYESNCERNRKNGAKGGRPKKEQGQESALACDAEQSSEATEESANPYEEWG
jgi:hypothetical protein